MIEGFYEACSTPSTSAKERRVVQGRQRGRLYPVSLIDPRRSIHPGSEWFSEDRTQADLADGPSASGLLRLVVGGSMGWRDELVGCGNLDSQIAGSSR
jgi:hypothetical protein